MNVQNRAKSLWHDAAFGSIHLLLWCFATMVWQCLLRKAIELELALSFSFSLYSGRDIYIYYFFEKQKHFLHFNFYEHIAQESGPKNIDWNVSDSRSIIIGIKKNYRLAHNSFYITYCNRNDNVFTKFVSKYL